MVTGFINLTVYILKDFFDDYIKRSEEIGRLFNHTPDKSRLKSINSPVFSLLIAD